MVASARGPLLVLIHDESDTAALMAAGWIFETTCAGPEGPRSAHSAFRVEAVHPNGMQVGFAEGRFFGTATAAMARVGTLSLDTTTSLRAPMAIRLDRARRIEHGHHCTDTVREHSNS